MIAEAGSVSRAAVDEIVRQTVESDLLLRDDDMRDDVLILRKRLVTALEFVDSVLRGGD